MELTFQKRFCENKYGGTTPRTRYVKLCSRHQCREDRRGTTPTTYTGDYHKGLPWGTPCECIVL